MCWIASASARYWPTSITARQLSNLTINCSSGSFPPLVIGAKIPRPQAGLPQPDLGGLNRVSNILCPARLILAPMLPLAISHFGAHARPPALPGPACRFAPRRRGQAKASSDPRILDVMERDGDPGMLLIARIRGVKPLKHAHRVVASSRRLRGSTWVQKTAEARYRPPIISSGVCQLER
jgi:hypothetical protein